MATTVNAVQATWPVPRQPGFNSPPLVRWLGSLGMVAEATAPPNLAERLGHWLDWTDAIALSTALNAAPAMLPASPTAATAPTPAQARSPLLASLQVRQALERAIGQDAALRAETALASAQAATAPAGAAFAPYRAHHRALQRKMDAQINALRTELQAALAAHSPAGAQLAALDAVMAQALAAREHHLLSTLPGLLEQQFNQLPPDQQACFHSTLQDLLLAELDMRLQPLEGLLEALGPVPDRTP